jgi:nicotinamide-nucleotide amidase
MTNDGALTMPTSPTDTELMIAANQAIDVCRAGNLRVTTAESCTGGMIVAALTEIAGSSDVVGRGFVTYSNEAKMEMLGVSEDTLVAHGAVSEATVREMTAGALAAAGKDADIVVAVSGVAGPGGGSPDKPVGTVWIAVERKGITVRAERQLFAGDRQAVRLKTVARALALISEVAG